MVMATKSRRWIVGLQVAAVWLGSWGMAEAWQGRIEQREVVRASLLITQEQFALLHESQRVLAVDVRTRASWDEGRIPGARHVPLVDVELRAQEVKDVAKGQLVVTYCSCPTEGSSLRAAEILVARGVQARALVGGFPQWMALGGRVER